MLLDSGAPISVVMSCLTPYFTSVYPSLTCAAATADGNSLSVSGQGELGPLKVMCLLSLTLNGTTAFLFHNYLILVSLFHLHLLEML